MTVPRGIAASPRRRDAVGIVGKSGRTIRFKLSDSSVARDGNTIATSGWQLANFKLNPVFLWAHDANQPPIGRFTEIGIVGDSLFGTVTFADAATYDFADTIYRLYQGEFLNACSVSWLPLQWKYSNTRPGGIDFSSVELLEVSAVPVPALAGALATARARGINTAPVERWLNRSPGLDAKARSARLAEVARLHRETAAADRRAEIAASAPPSTRAERIAEARALAAQVAREDEAAARRPVFKS